MSADGYWIYEHGDYELLLLDQVVKRGLAANRFVDYAPNYGRPSGVAPRFVESGFVESGLVESGRGRSGRRDRPPHLEQEPLVTSRVRGVGGVFELAAPVLGRPVIRSSIAPVVVTGESLDETSTSDHESRHDVVERSPGVWSTVHELGFRFVRVDVGADVGADEIEIESRVRPVQLTGSFESSNPRLNEIWATSARTLHLCMQGLMLDGIKRDRMPWIGDQALTTLANAYTFADGSIARDSITALGRPRHGYVNGIADYSLWWLINARQYQLHFDDLEHLAREADNIDAFLSNLDRYSEGGIFRPRAEADGFEGANAGSVFIDWGAEIDPARDFTALQVLWCWAVRSGAELLATAGHPAAGRWAESAATITELTVARGWNGSRWSEYLDGDDISPYPNFLAAVAGLPSSEDAIEAVTDAPRLGTPFMTSFALLAIGAPAVPRIEQLWGAMLDAGATTFWEEFAEGSPYAMYGRPFGKSLCHAWSSAPAALLPQLVLGIRPTSDGWATFEVRPELGELEWAAATVPTPHGPVRIRADSSGTVVEVPAGTRLGDHAGPCTVTL